MVRLGGIYWPTPATLGAALLAGILFAVGHHLFYSNLDGQGVPTGDFGVVGFSVSEQQFNISVGNTFAFLVKAALASAVSLAYVQAVWHSTKGSRKGEKLSTLDTTFSILENALGFLKVRVWVKYPLLLILAIIAWSIPIASIITPSTLSVKSVLSQPGVDTIFDNATLLECSFSNASYTANFTYVSGTQGINLEVNDVGVPLVPQNCIVAPEWDAGVFGNSTLEISEAETPNCTTFNIDGTPCEFDAKLVQTLAYQGVAGAFVQLIQGSIGLGGSGQPFPMIVSNTELVKTVLVDTDELAFIQTFSPGATLPDLPTEVAAINGTAFIGLSNNKTASTRGPLREALQDMFLNLTLSLMSETYLQPNYSSPFAPEAQTKVTLTTYHNVYSYSKRTLYIAYGASISFTVLAVAIGVGSLFSNGASYDRNFSTLLRVARTAALSEEITAEDGNGYQPLSKRLENARVVISSRLVEETKSFATVELMNDNGEEQ